MQNIFATPGKQNFLNTSESVLYKKIYQKELWSG